MQRERSEVTGLEEADISAFVQRSPKACKERIKCELAMLRLWRDYLRRGAGELVSPPSIDASPVETLVHRYVEYLRKDRGLAEHSVRVYSPLVRDFLADQLAKVDCVSPCEFDAPTIRNFLIERSRNRSSECTRLLATALRSFFRFLFLRGDTPIDLSAAVPTVRRWAQSAVCTFLSPQEIERLLAVPDRSTVGGRRDYAILLLLARLGLRAGEIVTLELDDIDWRSAELVVRGKGQILQRLPLLADVGEALACYLRNDRGAAITRRVFVRLQAPRAGLAGPAAVGHIVRRVLAQAGVRPASRGAAHLFRHSLATRMIRQGASIADIAEVLRHRSQNTTAIYAKVSFETLRSVARPWPGAGAVQ